MATEIILPALGETMDEGTIARWLVPSGTEVRKGQAIVEIESNKAVFEVEAPASGILHTLSDKGSTLPILSVIGVILAPGEPPPGVQAPAAAAAATTTGAQASPTPAAAAPAAAPEALTRQFVSPRARRFAAEKNVDLAQVKGTGPQGRIEERDVRAYLEQRPRVSPLARKIAAEAGVPLPTAGEGVRVSRADVEAHIAKAQPSAEAVTPMDGVRRVIAQRMAESAHTTASVTLTTEVDATELVHLREQVKGHIEQQVGEALSYNVLLAKLAAISLTEFPYMKTRLQGDGLHIPAAVNIGIAVDTPRGLLVPVLRDVSSKGLVALSAQAKELFAKARSGSLGADDMGGGVFTITNLGIYGIDAFTPIINLPECAILGVGRIMQKPAVWQGQIAIRHMVVLSLTFDHRLVDGAPAARFLQHLAQQIANPYVVLLG